MRKRMFAMLLLLAPMVASGATLSGSVRNGTTKSAAVGQTVVLIQLSGGMQEVDTTKTDAQGRFKFDRAEIGQQPFLVRVNYKSVNYHKNVPPGQSSADVEIFEPTATAADLHVASRALIVQPNGATLLVGEEYEVNNVSQPPAAFSGQFEFAIPEGAEIAQVSAWGAAGMPTVQGTINKGNNRFGLAFPLRPGQNGVRLSYQLPYNTQSARVGAASPYAIETAMVIAPPTMQISAAGLQAAGQREGWNVFARSAVPANEALNVAVSGTAPPPADAGATGQPGQASAAGAPAGAEVRTMPGRIDELKWVLAGGFAAVFFLGAIYLMRKPPALPAPAVAAAGGGAAAAPAMAAYAAPPVSSAAVAQAEQHVKQSLDELKDALFRLELRKQAGTISDEDYARERARTEQILRELVRG